MTGDLSHAGMRYPTSSHFTNVMQEMLQILPSDFINVY